MPTSLNGTVGNANNPNNQNDQVSFIVGEVSYAYTPNLGYTISGTVNLQDTYWLFPRCSTDSPANSSGPAYYDVKYTTSTTTCTCIQHLQQKTCYAAHSGDGSNRRLSVKAGQTAASWPIRFSPNNCATTARLVAFSIFQIVLGQAAGLKYGLSKSWMPGRGVNRAVPRIPIKAVSGGQNNG